MSKSYQVELKREQNYLKQLDGLRFIAVVLVLYDHWMAEDNKWPFGQLGVNLFFVLSGFLITRILLQSKAENSGQVGGLRNYLKKFYIRRTLRIFPIYYLSIIILWLFKNPSVVDKLSWHFLYATNIYIIHYGKWLGVTDHFWSLAVEEQFYLVFPLLLFFLPQNKILPLFFLTIIGSFGLRFYYHAVGADWIVPYVSMFTCLDCFGFGGIMAYLILFKKELFVSIFSNRRYTILSLLLLLGQLMIERYLTPGHGFAKDVCERTVASIFFFYLIGGAIVGYKGWLKWLLENSFSNYCGKISYGIYVYHNFIYNFYHTPPSHPVMKLFSHFPALLHSDILRLSLLFSISIAVASLSWYVIEKPINKLKDRFAG